MSGEAGAPSGTLAPLSGMARPPPNYPAASAARQLDGPRQRAALPAFVRRRLVEGA